MRLEQTCRYLHILAQTQAFGNLNRWPNSHRHWKKSLNMQRRSKKQIRCICSFWSLVSTRTAPWNPSGMPSCLRSDFSAWLLASFILRLSAQCTASVWTFGHLFICLGLYYRNCAPVVTSSIPSHSQAEAAYGLQIHATSACTKGVHVLKKPGGNQ